MITGIDHIEIIVRDLDDYVAFLTTLGFETVRQTDHHGRSVEMKPPGNGQPLFEIHQVSGEEVIGINLALKIDDAAAVHAALRATDVRIESNPRFIESTGRTNVDIRDPDGWQVQLVEFKRPDAPDAEAPDAGESMAGSSPGRGEPPTHQERHEGGHRTDGDSPAKPRPRRSRRRPP